MTVVATTPRRRRGRHPYQAPVSPTLEFNFGAFKHEPRAQALSIFFGEGGSGPCKKRRDITAPDEPDAEKDLATVQFRSEMFCAAMDVDREVRNFHEDVLRFQRTAALQPTTAAPPLRCRPKRIRVGLPSWLGEDGREVKKVGKTTVTTIRTNLAEGAGITVVEVSSSSSSSSSSQTLLSSSPTSPASPLLPTPLPTASIEDLGSDVSETKKRKRELETEIVISNGRDMLGTTFHYRPDCPYVGYLPDAEEVGDGIVYPRGTLMHLPKEVLEIVAGSLETISDLNRLASTCRKFRFMIEEWNLKDWLPTSIRDPLCAPFPHAVVASRARDLADWTVMGKNEIVDWIPRCVSRPCQMSEEQRRDLFHNCVTHGYLGLMEIAALKIGVQLRHLRLFQLRKQELRHLFDFNIRGSDADTLFHRPGLSPSAVRGVCREMAVVNKYVYCELFHHDVENLALRLAQQITGLGSVVRQDWLYYCVPDMCVPDPLPCQNMHRGVDRLMLMSFLGDIGMAWWNDEMEYAYERRAVARPDDLPIDDADFVNAAGRAIHVIATNTIDIAFPPVNGVTIFRAKNEGMEIAACKDGKIDKQIMEILQFQDDESRLRNPLLGREREVIDMGDFHGLDHDLWLSVQRE